MKNYVFGLLVATLLSISNLASADSLPSGVTIGKAILYERSAGSESKLFGSESNLLRGYLQLYSPKQTSYSGVNVLIPCGIKLEKADFQNLLTKSGAKGVLVCVSYGDENLLHVSQVLSSSYTTLPIFSISQAESSSIESHLTSSTPLVVSAGASAILTAPYPNNTVTSPFITTTVLHKGKELREKEKGVSRVALSSHFDTMGAFPTHLTTGGASGNVAALELLRRFSTNHAEQPYTSPFELFFMMGSTARLNYAGTTVWLAERKETDLDNYRLFVALDELVEIANDENGDGPILYMHIQDTFKKRADGVFLIDLAKSVSAACGIELKIQAAKTNYQHHDVRFEHEVFANRQLPSVTFSTRRAPQVDQLFRDGNPILSEAAVAAFEKRISFIEKFITAVLDMTEEERVDRSYPGTTSYLSGLLHHAGASSRCPLAANGTALVAYADVVEAQVRQTSRKMKNSNTAVSTKRQDSTIAGSVVFFGPYEQELKVFVAKPMLEELVYAVGIVALVLLFAWKELEGNLSVLWSE
ncbi:nicalin [Angomonas deanei]|uniref:Nicastrin n=1 Tax=Angomonas deanei TaxID=59799 RepID=A0A7G2C7U5_9TRYP|nr:nicalin [Angomonas deanei]CAD2215816.1 hypothetical protein, conserved [Angomonas deanei]|eukprot:EPY24313.1 nicalin [Angomonas deanei]